MKLHLLLLLLSSLSLSRARGGRRRGGRGGRGGRRGGGGGGGYKWKRGFGGGGGYGYDGGDRCNRHEDSVLFPGGVEYQDIRNIDNGCAIPDGGCSYGHGSNDDGVFVCRTVYQRLTGNSTSYATCIDPEKSVDGDVCGCCEEDGGVCPKPCECACDLYSGRGRWNWWNNEDEDEDAEQGYRVRRVVKTIGEGDEAAAAAYGGRYRRHHRHHNNNRCMRPQEAMTKMAQGKVECDCDEEDGTDTGTDGRN